MQGCIVEGITERPDCRWERNWITHLDGIFQTVDRKGDYDVHFAKGVRRMVITDTMEQVPGGFECDSSSPPPLPLLLYGRMWGY